jgi:hypothetical protein
MITRDNIKEVIKQLPKRDTQRLLSTDKEYAVLYLHFYNAGSFTTLRLTNDFNRYKNVSDHGNCILAVEDVISYI